MCGCCRRRPALTRAPPPPPRPPQLRVLAGKHIHEDGAVVVLGRSSFFDTSLNAHRA